MIMACNTNTKAYKRGQVPIIGGKPFSSKGVLFFSMPKDAAKKSFYNYFLMKKIFYKKNIYNIL